MPATPPSRLTLSYEIGGVTADLVRQCQSRRGGRRHDSACRRALESAREPPSLTAQRHSARDQSSRWLVPRGAASDGRSAGLPPGCSASRSPGAVPGSLAETGPRCRAAETHRPPPCPRPSAGLKARGTITSPSRRGVGRSASHRDDRPRTSRHDRQALRAGPAPERQRTFPTRTYLSHILLSSIPSRMGERYVHATKVRSRRNARPAQRAPHPPWSQSSRDAGRDRGARPPRPRRAEPEGCVFRDPA